MPFLCGNDIYSMLIRTFNYSTEIRLLNLIYISNATTSCSQHISSCLRLPSVVLGLGVLEPVQTLIFGWETRHLCTTRTPRKSVEVHRFARAMALPHDFARRGLTGRQRRAFLPDLSVKSMGKTPLISRSPGRVAVAVGYICDIFARRRVFAARGARRRLITSRSRLNRRPAWREPIEALCLVSETTRRRTTLPGMCWLGAAPHSVRSEPAEPGPPDGHLNFRLRRRAEFWLQRCFPGGRSTTSPGGRSTTSLGGTLTGQTTGHRPATE